MRAARRYRFTGMVQGVGFRWTAKRIADGLGLDGWVRNDDDDGVTLVAEGDPRALDDFQSRMADAMGAYIARTEVTEAAPGNYRDGFDVAR
ncbi:MAG: acylphosphatase [Planctomycetaceae bacterium]|nr:acylphosphatase [Planctomycetaceae bacterium]